MNRVCLREIRYANLFVPICGYDTRVIPSDQNLGDDGGGVSQEKNLTGESGEIQTPSFANAIRGDENVYYFRFVSKIYGAQC
jgi:hypothetical protein